MSKTITFNELRRLKDSLPDGSTHRIADELNVTVQTVRNYFGGPRRPPPARPGGGRWCGE